jgi:exocyst complex component 3
MLFKPTTAFCHVVYSQVCRGFLEVAKEAAKRVVGAVFNDPGMSAQLKAMFSTSPDWLSGRTTGDVLQQ